MLWTVLDESILQSQQSSVMRAVLTWYLVCLGGQPRLHGDPGHKNLHDVCRSAFGQKAKGQSFLKDGLNVRDGA